MKECLCLREKCKVILHHHKEYKYALSNAIEIAPFKEITMAFSHEDYSERYYAFLMFNRTRKNL